jgi:hypothetical protein
MMAQQKVFGIGLNKTGTKTLGWAMQHLGYRNATFNGQLMRRLAAGQVQPILDYAQHYDSFEDWPWPLVYQRLARAYPDATFVLTLRSSAQAWYDSLYRHAKRHGPSPWRKIAYGYPNPWDAPQHHLDLYARHGQEVVDFFRDEPDRLLTVCWEAGHGWPELCGFLDLAVPDVAFPKVNVDGSESWRFMPGANFDGKT